MLVETRKNVVIVPYRKAWIGGPDIAAIPEHGRITRAGIPADEFRPIRTEPAPLAGHWLYGGPLKVHFGHVIMDSIIRLWAFDPARHDGVLFPYLPQPPKDIPEWFLEIAALFGVERHQVRVIRSPIAAESVDFAEPGERPRENPSGWYLRFLDALPLRHESETPRHVYLGRTHMIHRGTLMGESYFADALRGAGFVYVEPERYDIHRQVSILRNAERIVFMEGSAIYSAALLSRIEAPVFMIPRRRGGHSIFDPMLTSRGRYLSLGETRAIRRENNRHGRIRPDSPSFTSDPAAIHADMLRHGLIHAPFDLAAFTGAERSDTEMYFREDQPVPAQETR